MNNNEYLKHLEEVLELKLPDEYRIFLINYQGKKPTLSGFFILDDRSDPESDTNFPLPLNKNYRAVELNVIIPRKLKVLVSIGHKQFDVFTVARISKKTQPWLPKESIPIGFDSDERTIIIFCSGINKGKVGIAMPAPISPLYERYDWDIDTEAERLVSKNKSKDPVLNATDQSSVLLYKIVQPSFDGFIKSLRSPRPIFKSGYVPNEEQKKIIKSL